MADCQPTCSCCHDQCDAFGHYLSGFTDGEGSFMLRLRQKGRWYCPNPIFSLILRKDDIAILYSFQEYLGCGAVRTHIRNKGNRKPACEFSVRTIRELHDCVIPHFEKYPLRAKKRNDFEVWKKAVRYVRSVQLSRPYRGTGMVRWTPGILDTYRQFQCELTQARSYEANTTITHDTTDRENAQLLMFVD